MKASFFRGVTLISAQIQGYNPAHPESIVLLNGSNVERLRKNCSSYSINELKDIHEQLNDWLLAQDSEFDIPIGYRDYHARLGQVIDGFVAEYLLKDKDTEDE